MPLTSPAWSEKHCYTMLAWYSSEIKTINFSMKGQVSALFKESATAVFIVNSLFIFSFIISLYNCLLAVVLREMLLLELGHYT